ncbi:PAS domain-containing sensor histidine kinase [Ralstonia mannitolilytica]|uniref:PAS domain-containing sensor histidine kinase n=1 Tax=Ralstonia mannitolilytica TaxID=105219 RepID=UPI0005EBE458|nr:ATP-binding protein [Ralstonia mannitolilytica]MBU9577218.1 PAS domain-containing protein [Ralstonia mannitolilytica]QIF10260.1 PAS domain-containing protein [Ralstonia mannitolilytica]CAJ0734676.1 Adaptive-response sensory-kinase SasA [Ralstonia mannitolilytica]CAJ0788469.1 Adaptive-response sensory-kinase SasA [Ralstonia mannitolilytica]
MADITPSQLSDAIAQLVSCGVFSVDRHMRILSWNRFMQYHSGRSADEVLGQDMFALFPELPEKWLRKKIESVFVLGVSAYTSWEHRPYLFRFRHTRPITDTIEWMQQNCSFIPIEDEHGVVIAVGITLLDATDVCLAYGELKKREKIVTDALQELTVRNAQLSALNEELAQAHQQLLQSEKLAAIGQLAAGIAHEINNPVGFVLSNLNSLQRYMGTLLDYARGMEQLITQAAPSLDPQLAALAQAADIDYLTEDAPALVAESKEGLARVRDIVVDLRDFSRVDSKHQWEQVDIHRCIESTLNIVHNEIKYQADLVREYSTLPPVMCIPSQINQVVLNLVVNAAQAYAKKAESGGERGVIAVRTGCDAPDPGEADAKASVWLEVADAGCGIPPENLKRIFDPFFTTKPVGKGTGLGLSVTYGIVQAHGGRIDVSSTVGKGTTFRVTLPVGGPAPALASEPAPAVKAAAPLNPTSYA